MYWYAHFTHQDSGENDSEIERESTSVFTGGGGGGKLEFHN